MTNSDTCQNIITSFKNTIVAPSIVTSTESETNSLMSEENEIEKKRSDPFVSVFNDSDSSSVFMTDDLSGSFIDNPTDSFNALSDNLITDNSNNFEKPAISKISDRNSLTNEVIEYAGSDSSSRSLKLVVNKNTLNHSRSSATQISSSKLPDVVDCSPKDNLIISIDSSVPTASDRQFGISSPSISETFQKNHSALTSDFNGCMVSLEDKNWVSSTAVERLLRIFSVAQFRIVDHTYVSVHDLKTLENKNLLSIKSEVHTIVLPILWENHWTVAFFNIDNGTVEIWDSLIANNNIKIKCIIEEFGRFLSRHDRGQQMKWHLIFKVSFHNESHDNSFVF